MTGPILFAFQPETHEYIDQLTGEIYPNISLMLERAGHVDDLWLTAESRYRGREVHKLTADVDLEALDPYEARTPYKNWLLAYAKAREILKPQGLEILKVEEALVHPVFRFAGTIDRVVMFEGRRGVMEIKSGGPVKSHRYQTALQAILDSVDSGIPAEHEVRLCLYLKESGKFELEEHVDRRGDFAKAHEMIAAL